MKIRNQERDIRTVFQIILECLQFLDDQSSRLQIIVKQAQSTDVQQSLYRITQNNAEK